MRSSPILSHIVLAAASLAALTAYSAGAQTTCYELTLEGALPAKRDVVALVSAEGGRVADCAVMVAGDPETIQRPKEPRWNLEGGRLTGPLAIRLGTAMHRMDLDASLQEGGTYQVHYGCPTAPREASGDVTIEFPAKPNDKRHVVWLHGALGEKTRLGLILNLDRAAKTLAAVSGWASGYNRGNHVLDAAGLTFDGVRLEGEVNITVVADGFVPEHGQPVEGRIRLKASLDAKEKAGDYSALFGIDKTLPGRASAKTISDGRMKALLAVLSQPVSAATPWRVWLVTGPRVHRGPDNTVGVAQQGRRGRELAALTAANAQLSEMPPENWAAPDYDDSVWGRYCRDLFEYIGGYGRAIGGTEPASLRLRTRFGVSDPQRATDVQVTVEYLGGVVVYVNGEEVGRGHMPEGKPEPHTVATAYPLDAYTTDDGVTPLPSLSYNAEPDAKFLDRYRARVRSLTLAVPPKVLVKGGNVLAVDVRRAPVNGPMGERQSWCHLAVRSLRVQSISGAGVVAYADAVKGTRVWSAQAVEQVTETPAPKSLLHFGWGGVGLRANGLKGIDTGNPYDPLAPIRILVPRNGIGNGQAVLSDPDGLRGVTASLGAFVGPGNAALPKEAARVRFAAQGRDLHYCNELREEPPEGARTAPVWIEVAAPKEQTPGWYVSVLSLAANGQTFRVPVQVLVAGFVVPDSRDFRSRLAGMHSPEALAKAYQAPAWSEEHFRLMDRSLEVLGQIGCDVMFVPVILDSLMGHESGLIRWVRTGAELRPDFSLFEKYLDLYVKHCGPPKIVSLSVWSEGTATEIADAYEGRRIPSRAATPRQQLRVTQWDPATGATTSIPAPSVLAEGAEAFWKPMVEGVRRIVKKRGWPEQIIVLGVGGDRRPSQRTGELWRQWAPYARWDLYSHFSGDPRPDPATGRLIATGGLEVGLKECPDGWSPYSAAALEKLWQTQAKIEFMDVRFHRCCWDDRSGPMPYRTVPSFSGLLTRIGVDYWPGFARCSAPGMVWGTYPVRLTWRGPRGPAPTVRLQMVREALQDFEARMAILDRLAKLSEAEQQPYRQLLDEYPRRCAVGEAYLSQTELSLDWPAYVARLYAAAGKLAGMEADPAWGQAGR